MNDTWDEYANGWDKNPDARNYSEKAFQRLLEVAEIEGALVFDFGCGTGLLTEKIAPHATAIVALDNSEKMIEILKGKNLRNVEAIFGSLEEFLMPSETKEPTRFDLVVASSVCSFVSDYEGTLQKLHTILKPGGRLVQWDWFSPDGSSHPGFTKKQISTAMTQAGFQAVSVSDGFTMLGEKDEALVLMGVGISSSD